MQSICPGSFEDITTKPNKPKDPDVGARMCRLGIRCGQLPKSSSHGIHFVSNLKKGVGFYCNSPDCYMEVCHADFMPEPNTKRMEHYPVLQKDPRNRREYIFRNSKTTK